MSKYKLVKMFFNYLCKKEWKCKEANSHNSIRGYKYKENDKGIEREIYLLGIVAKDLICINDSNYGIYYLQIPSEEYVMALLA